jgi:hypothetical protein
LRSRCSTHVCTAPVLPQHEREAELAIMLGALLRRYVEGDVEGFLVRTWLALFFF